MVFFFFLVFLSSRNMDGKIELNFLLKMRKGKVYRDRPITMRFEMTNLRVICAF